MGADACSPGSLGKIVQVFKGQDDKVLFLQVDIGRVLGLGTKVVTSTAEKFEQLPGITLLVCEKDVRPLPEAPKQESFAYPLSSAQRLHACMVAVHRTISKPAVGSIPAGPTVDSARPSTFHPMSAKAGSL